MQKYNLMTGINDRTVIALSHDKLREVPKKYNPWRNNAHVARAFLPATMERRGALARPAEERSR